MIKVGVVGAKGRMGQAAVEAVKWAGDLQLVAAIDLGIPPSALVEAGSQVVIDFTTPDAVMRTLRSCIDNGIHCVVASGIAGRPARPAAIISAVRTAVPDGASTLPG